MPSGSLAVESPVHSLMNGDMTYSWTLRNAESSTPLLRLTMATPRDQYVSWGLAPDLMNGPILACYFDPGATAATCSEWDGSGLAVTRRLR